ncbi:hypothetical protein RFI_35343, partial [Reticulomyxa filosa]
MSCTFVCFDDQDKKKNLFTHTHIIFYVVTKGFDDVREAKTLEFNEKDVESILSHRGGYFTHWQCLIVTKQTNKYFKNNGKDTIAFILCHYAGDVNKDELDRGLLIILDKSKEPRDPRQQKATLSLQLGALMKTLRQCNLITFDEVSRMKTKSHCTLYHEVALNNSRFPLRLKHGKFAERYKCILEDAGRTGCTNIVKFLNMKRENIRERVQNDD